MSRASSVDSAVVLNPGLIKLYSTTEARCEAAEAGDMLSYMTADSCSTIEAIEPDFNDDGGSLCFYVLRAFLPALPGKCRYTDLRVKLPPGGGRDLTHWHRRDAC